MSIPNISSLLIERERRNMFQYSAIKVQHGIPTYNSFIMVPGNIATGVEVEGFIFGRDIWGVGVFSEETSDLAEKYGIS